MAGYGDDAGLSARLEALGRTLPDDAPSLAVLREIGSAYIDGAYGLRFPGQPTDGVAQERAWPRTGAADYYGNTIASDAIPAAVINASYEAAWIEATAPGSLSVVGSNASRVKRERVEGAVEVEYVGSTGSDVASDNAVVSTVIEGLLAPFLLSRTTPAVFVV